jgi:hypothetical protein
MQEWLIFMVSINPCSGTSPNTSVLTFTAMRSPNLTRVH